MLCTLLCVSRLQDVTHVLLHLVVFTNSADCARVSPVASLLYMMIPFFANYPIGPCCLYLNNSIVDIQLSLLDLNL